MIPPTSAEPDARTAEIATAGAEHSDPGARSAVYVFCTELELADPSADVSVPEQATAVRVLVRLHRIPLGFRSVAPEVFADRKAVLATVTSDFRDRILEHLDADGSLPGAGGDVLVAARQPCQLPRLDDHVTVVVATRNRPSHVRECLRTLTSLDYSSFDVVVVDNAPDTDETQRSSRRSTTTGSAT